MLVGHYGVAFALKRAEPRISLGTLFLAVMLVDILWGATLLLGWEHARIVPGFTAASPLEFLDYPITHSLLAGFAWGAVAALIYFSWPTRNVSHHWRAAGVVGLAVLSHWILDLPMHVRDLPLTMSDQTKLGFGLWNSIPLTLVAELGTLAAGAALYTGLRSRRHPVQPARFAILLAVLVVVMIAATFSPAPATMRSVALGSSGFGIVMALAARWADRVPAEAAADYRRPAPAA
ncbi:MAG: hypothetical protein H0U85_08515 [Gemmatimonadales bacterium]|nr:hypothetical protein [Gemmatimonadales bacterium]